MAIREGALFDGRYQVEAPLGRGGMGEVWAATRITDGRRVAIKVLLEKAARKPELVARFEREAKIAQRLQSPFICQLLATGRAESGELYIVFELLEGETLGDHLKTNTEMPYAELAPVMDDVLEGLCAAHHVGVVHRDLKPGNIFLARGGGMRPRAVILDFGISKVLPRGRSKEEASLTTFDATLGSFAYMAPEQVRGAARADERADVYAVGAVVFRALAGRLPFEGTTAQMLLTTKLGSDSPSLSETTGDQWPAGLERFVARALARRREDRFASADEALTAWRAEAEKHSLAVARAASLSGEDGRHEKRYGRGEVTTLCSKTSCASVSRSTMCFSSRRTARCCPPRSTCAPGSRARCPCSSRSSAPPWTRSPSRAPPSRWRARAASASSTRTSPPKTRPARSRRSSAQRAA